MCSYIIYHQRLTGHDKQSNLVETALRWRSTDLLSTNVEQKKKKKLLHVDFGYKLAVVHFKSVPGQNYQKSVDHHPMVSLGPY